MASSAESVMEGLFNEEDQSSFRALNSHNSRLFPNLRPCPDDMKAHIRAYGQKIRSHTFSHQETTGTNKRPFTHDFESHIVQQATPAVLSLGCALMTTIGYEGGVDELSETKFIESHRDSAKLVRACYNHMEHWEKPSSLLDAGAAKRMTEAGCLPFVSLFPWYEQDPKDFIFASGLLLSYLRKTKPLILFTYGPLPTYLAYVSFETHNPGFLYEKKHAVDGCPATGLDFIGKPELCKIGSTGDDVVVIPTTYVDYPAKGAQLPKNFIPKHIAARLCLFTHAIAWYAMDVALRCDKDTSRSWSREQICRTVVMEVNKVIDKDHTFGHRFYRIKGQALGASLPDDDDDDNDNDNDDDDDDAEL
jgi:hypothetical protein